MRLRPAPALVAGLALALGLGAAACSGGSESGDAQCVAAFRNADPRALPANRVSPLDDAIKVCPDVGSWRRAWDAVPGAHAGHDDPLAYLSTRCQVQELTLTQLCRSLAGSALARTPASW